MKYIRLFDNVNSSEESRKKDIIEMVEDCFLEFLDNKRFKVSNKCMSHCEEGFRDSNMSHFHVGILKSCRTYPPDGVDISISNIEEQISANREFGEILIMIKRLVNIFRIEEDYNDVRIEIDTSTTNFYSLIISWDNLEEEES